MSLVLIALIGFLTTACAVQGSKKKKEGDGTPVVTECVLPTEQANTLQGKWAAAPIKLSFYAGAFDASEVDTIQKGGQTWNDFFTKSKGLSIFDMGPPSTGYLSTNNQNTPSCSSSTLSEGTVIYKRASSWTKSASAIAVTTTCYTPNNDGLATIFNAILEFNYVNFFVSTAQRKPDLQSIAVHELGHLMGLDHSCGPLGRPNQNKANVVCPDFNVDPANPLLETVMFPQVFFDPSGEGEVKQNLHANDQGRANCLY